MLGIPNLRQKPERFLEDNSLPFFFICCPNLGSFIQSFLSISKLN